METRPEERWLQQVLDAMTDQIAVLDRHGTILMVNEGWRRFGRDNGSAEPSCFGVNYLEVCRRSAIHEGEGADQARQVLKGVRAVLEGKLAHFELEYSCHSPRERRWFVLNATPLTASPGGAVITHVNVTSRKLREQEALRQAHQDSLTGLGNRRRIEAQAVPALANCRRSGGSAAVFLLDLDGFKEVNDTFGHHAGDHVLREVAARLQARVRSTDLLARLGGDEFAVLLTGVDAHGARTAADSFLATLSLPMRIEGAEVFVGASIGLALYPEHGRTFADLLRVADAEMYRVKAAGTASPFQGQRTRKLRIAPRAKTA